MGIALSEVTNNKQEIVISCDATPVFNMKDFRVTFQQKLEEHVKRVIVTRLKEYILKELRRLQEKKKENVFY